MFLPLEIFLSGLPAFKTKTKIQWVPIVCHALYQMPGYLPKVLKTQKHNAKGHIRKINKIQSQYPININFSAVFGHEVLHYLQGNCCYKKGIGH